ncbi:MAG: hypothetical protein C5B50_15165 [Verrucomicrobia bacterium]|nr:MAG: hypothetical protein C5B50_15165 [Verrucomicrobiota bacterium]
MRLPVLFTFHVSRFTILIAFCLSVAWSTATAGFQPLQKIRIAKDGRSFVTEDGKPFVPFGVNYYRPGTGWAPQIWKQFDSEATRKDFSRMKELGVNCVRVFLTYHSFYSEPGVLKQEGLEKFDQFLKIAEEAHIYVHPAGPEHWEGPPNWRPVAIADARTLEYTVQFWKLFAARYKGQNVIFAYDLKNEPDIEWNNEIILPQWNTWLRKKYGSEEQLQSAWATNRGATVRERPETRQTSDTQTNALKFGKIAIPEPFNSLLSPRLLDFQSFREDLADTWTRSQAEAIKSVDPHALVTVGCLQTTIPSRFWGGIEDYTGFRPSRQARFLDFLEIHFYPSEGGGYEYRNEKDELANLAYLEGIVREVAKAGKPVVLAEFGWYGGAEKPKFDHGAHPIGTEEQQAKYMRRAIEVSQGFVVGWLNWGFYDHPGATDCSELTGLLTVDGKVKAWGKTFQQLASHYNCAILPVPKIGPRPDLDWNACRTSSNAADQFRGEYLKAFLRDARVK